MTIEAPGRARPGLGIAIRRALLRRCLNCGEAGLSASYLKQVERCAVCGERYGHLRSDDAAPRLTILVVGRIVMPLLLAVETRVS